MQIFNALPSHLVPDRKRRCTSHFIGCRCTHSRHMPLRGRLIIQLHCAFLFGGHVAITVFFCVRVYLPSYDASFSPRLAPNFPSTGCAHAMAELAIIYIEDGHIDEGLAMITHAEDAGVLIDGPRFTNWLHVACASCRCESASAVRNLICFSIDNAQTTALIMVVTWC